MFLDCSDSIDFIRLIACVDLCFITIRFYLFYTTTYTACYMTVTVVLHIQGMLVILLDLLLPTWTKTLFTRTKTLLPPFWYLMEASKALSGVLELDLPKRLLTPPGTPVFSSMDASGSQIFLVSSKEQHHS
ncbi:uncharacterized protein LOC143855672 [Tasmannia lanceolata]|uniref:uncharacterized protein LOC143855672 n=1 Tax=Tasmannia lanceolata TaxID=3420 RepID=UPI004064B08D